MKNVFLFRAFAILLLCFLSAGCGGGSSSSPTPPSSDLPPNNPPSTATNSHSHVVANASEYSRERIKEAARALAEQKYTGKTTEAVLDIDSSSEVLFLLFSTARDFRMPLVAREYIEEQLNQVGSIELSKSCSANGTANIKGQVYDTGIVKVSIEFTQCQDYLLTPSFFRVDGTLALVIEEFDENSWNGFAAYDDLSFKESNAGPWIDLYGLFEYEYFTESNNTSDFKHLTKNYFTAVDAAEKTVLYANNKEFNRLDIYTTDQSHTGSLYIHQHGKVEISALNFNDPPPYADSGAIELLGSNKSKFDIVPPHKRFKFSVDTTSNGNYDKGLYFKSGFEFMEGAAAISELTDLTELSMPPNPFRLQMVTERVQSGYLASDNIKVLIENVSDDDTPYSDLTYSYEWYLNGVARPDISNTNTFPAGVAKRGNRVGAKVIVSDQHNRLPSGLTTVIIDDSLPELAFSDIPAELRSGDVVQFQASIIDYDEPNNGAVPVFTKLPIGASVDSEGIVTWNIPENEFFNEQKYSFSVNIDYETYSSMPLKETISLTVNDSMALPQITSQIKIPYNRNTVFVGDFDDSEGNELLTTDNRGTVYLKKLVGDKFKRTWAYPFRIESPQKFNEPLSGFEIATLDRGLGTNKKNILVNTAGVLFEFTQLDKAPKELLRLSSPIKLVFTEDIDKDGVDELFVSIDSASTSQLRVYELTDLDQPIYEGRFDWFTSLDVGNIDDDSAYEIVLSNGTSIDTHDWTIQDHNFSIFGNVRVADIDGDAIDEIIGKINGRLSVLSGISNTLTVIGPFEFDNNNVFEVTNVDQDEAKELVVNQSSGNDIQIYDFVNNQFVSRYQRVEGDNSRFSALTTGDINNDGREEAVAITNEQGNLPRFSAYALGEASSQLLNEPQPIIQNMSFAGWASVDGVTDGLIYLVDVFNELPTGLRFQWIKKNEEVYLSEQFSSKISPNFQAVVSDFNNDSFGEIIVDQFQDGIEAVSVIQLSDLGTWREFSQATYNSSLRIEDTFDINGDGHEDAIFFNKNKLSVADLLENEIIAEYQMSDNGLRNLIPFRHNDSSYLLLSDVEEISLLIFDGSGIQKIDSIPTQNHCSVFALVNIDSDTSDEILCVEDGYNGTDTALPYKQTLKYFNIVENRLTLSNEFPILEAITALAVDPRSTREQSFFVTLKPAINYFANNKSRVAYMDYDGTIIWEGPSLVGNTENNFYEADLLKARLNDNNRVELHISTHLHHYFIEQK